LARKFSKIVNSDDNLITFNYDLILEKALLSYDIWSPLDGYVAISDFEWNEDKECLEKRNKYSKLRIHKMHGSINWGIPGIPRHLRKDHNVVIVMDNLETQGFHFDGLLSRKPVQISYGGQHEPLWTLPSFIKPFEGKETYEIWQSAINVISKTDELVIIGYSFRPEDSNALLLLSTLPPDCNIKLIDPRQEEIKKRLEKKGFRVAKTFKSLGCYLSMK
jgi:hypothetical protein